MPDALLPYYEKELSFIRQLGKEFSEQHPKIASRLGIAEDTIEDPHVSRMIESFAYLNARIQYKLDDDFPEISEAFLNTIYPHYLRPIPSCSITQFNPDPENIDSIVTIPEDSLLDTAKFNDSQCRFKTVYPVDLFPIYLKKAQIKSRPFSTPGSMHAEGAGSVLHLKLKAINNDFEMHELDFSKIRFYLKGQSQFIYPFYELLLRNCHGIAMTCSEDDTQPVYLDKNSIRQVGFDDNQGLLPYPERSFIGYRLLTEFFIFPEKFMFIDIVDIGKHMNEKYHSEINLYIYLNEADINLERNINKDCLLLGCTPVVNLFPQQAEPIKATSKQKDYEVIPDARAADMMEIYSIDDVSATNTNGQIEKYREFYGINHETSDNDTFWYAKREFKHTGNKKYVPQTLTRLTLSNVNFNADALDDRILLVQTTCSNHDLPSIIPIGSAQADLHCINDSPPTDSIRFIHQPTATFYPPLRHGALWRLISHLNLNHLSLTGSDDSLASLKEILRLYDFADKPSTKAIIESISSIRIKQITAPVYVDGMSTLCRGLEVLIELDNKSLSGISSYLFASILERFFTLYCPINSFVKCTTSIKGKEGILKTCSPLSGAKIIL